MISVTLVPLVPREIELSAIKSIIGAEAPKPLRMEFTLKNEEPVLDGVYYGVGDNIANAIVEVKPNLLKKVKKKFK